MYVAESKPIYNNKNKISSAKDVFNEVSELQKEQKEHFIAIYLDGANRVLKKETVSVGTLNQSLVHPREVFRTGVMLNCASIIVVHNHPSGVCKASEEDIVVTQRLREAGKILGIELLDHLIIVEDGYLSLKEEIVF
jgi:DNA repair protein RadC